jgi:hypothetical protein
MSAAGVYRELEETIHAAKRKRVSAEDRIERAWTSYWKRWLSKFDAEDHDMVRRECAERILAEIDEEPPKRKARKR